MTHGYEKYTPGSTPYEPSDGMAIDTQFLVPRAQSRMQWIAAEPADAADDAPRACVGIFRCGSASTVWHGTVRNGTARHGKAGHTGTVRYSTVCITVQYGTVCAARWGTAHGLA